MSVKCAIIKYDYNNPAPTYKEIDINLDKGGKVLFGGGKRKSKTTPYLDKVESLSRSFKTFSYLLFPHLEKHHHYFEFYFFDTEAHETMLYLKYPNQVITHFIIDGDLIDNLQHLSWSYNHLDRYTQQLASVAGSLSFFKDKEIGDAKFQKAFSPYLKASNKLEDEIISASQRISDMAGLIFKSGW